MTALPINIDCGENFGRYLLFDEHPITRLATMVNVACGFHAGDYNSTIATLELMKNNGINRSKPLRVGVKARSNMFEFS